MFTKSWLSWFWQSGLVGLLTLMGVGEGVFGGVISKTLAQSNQPPSVGTVVTVNGNVFEITGGTTVGGRNLFHSFTNFSVPSDRTASFLNDIGIVNILARVTGGNPSDIQGTIRANGTANLFLMNPYGIIFGPNARLEVGGSFVATTASAIQFPGDNKFSLNSTVDSQNPLLSVNPSALLFNQIQNAAIENRSTAISGSNSVGTNVLGLRVPDGRSLLLVGGDVNLNRGRLNALGGHVEIGGLAGDGTVGIDVDGNNLRLSFPENIARANVTLTNAAEANVVADNGGSLTINAQNLELSENSFLRAGIRRDSGGVNSRAGDITLDVPGSVKIGNSFIFNNLQSRAVGKGGNINVRSGALSITDGAQIVAATFGSGDAGSVLVQADEAVSLAGRNTTIFSSVEAGGVGNGGGINITASSLLLNNGAQLQTSVYEASGSLAAGRGDAGNVNINVRDAVTIDGANGIFPSGVFTSVERGVVGNGGNINITAESISLTNGAQLLASTSGQGKAGTISLTARGAISFGTPGSEIGSSALSTVDAGAVGDGGDIRIAAESLSLFKGSQLGTIVRGSSGSVPGGRGNAGNVSIDVRNRLTIAGVGSDGLRSGILSGVETGAVGNGGNINIQTGSVSLFDDGLLNADMSGQGKAGNLSIQATDTVSLRNALISSSLGKGAEGKGGNIRLNARALSLTDGAQVSVATFGLGDAGSVFVQADEAVSLAGRNTTIFSSVEAGGVGNGGGINITASSLLLNNGAQLQTSVYEASGSLAAGRGDAGNVNINVRDAVTIDGANGIFPSGVFTSVERGVVGNGGNINITAESISLTNGAQLLASTSGQGKAGTISLTARGAISFGTPGSEIGSSALSTVDAGAVGDGGDIRIAAESLSLFKGSQLGTIVRGSSGSVPGGRGNAGNVSIDVRNRLTIAGVGSDGLRSGILSGVETGAVGNGGNINIQTGSVSLFDDGLLNADMSGQGKAGNLSIQATDTVSLRNALISSSLGKGAEGKGGNIRLNARALSLTDGAQVSVATFGLGDAGSVFVQADEAVSLAGRNTTIFSSVEAGGVGNGGGINITASSLLLNNGAQLQTSVYEASGSLAAGRGDAGNVNINVRDAVTMDGASGAFFSGVGTSVGRGVVGNGGDINITAGSLSLTNGGQLTSSTSGQGKAGTISLTARGAISFDGTANSGLGSAVLSTVNAGAVGDGGDIRITGDSLSLTNGAQLATTVRAASDTLTGGRGNAGNVSIDVRNRLTIAGVDSDGFASGIFSRVETGVVGNGGNIGLQTGSVSLFDGAVFNANMFGQGKAGNISLQVSDIISLRNASIFTNLGEGAEGQGGDIQITANSLSLTDGTQLVASSRGRGNAGNIFINVRETLQSKDSSISTAATQFTGGTIDIAAKNIRLRGDSDIRTNVSIGASGGGNITLTANSIIAFDDSDILAFARDGKGGDVIFNTPAFFGSGYKPAPKGTDPEILNNNNRVDINASGSTSGIISLPDTSLIQNSLTELPENSIDTNALIASSCIARSNQQKGTFVITGSGGLPNRPRDASVSLYSTGSVRTVPSNTRPSNNSMIRQWQKGDPIVEPQGIYQLPNGKLVLSRECAQ
ncbi:filamentous hemagglutinin N-terminal domain-containing protein [Scytonema tolypothrichoides VB-61278_2]|uniref:Filamentous hemagglutinin N-terminal domain-containing protein n=1 Tax=Scytonema tolypothrichoides VB-61278_2 TaxID=3232314 RepID=A0ABW8WID4_9CYAN